VKYFGSNPSSNIPPYRTEAFLVILKQRIGLRKTVLLFIAGPVQSESHSRHTLVHHYYSSFLRDRNIKELVPIFSLIALGMT
jgi:hypothetical protein